MDERTEIASRLMAGLLSGDPEYPIMAATEIATKGADDLLGYLSQTSPGDYKIEDGPKQSAPTPQRDPDTEPEDAQEEAPEPSGEADTSLRDLGVSGRACAPLERMGVETLAQLAVQARKDISSVRGVSTDSLKHMDSLLETHGLTWEYSPGEETEESEDDLL